MVNKDVTLTKFETSLLKGALRANSKAFKWAARFLYTVLFVSTVSFLYLFLRTGSPEAWNQALLLILAAMAFHTMWAYQSLIRKLYSSEHAQGERKE